MSNKQYDLVVAGGGFSGVAAAIAAARDGVRVLLIERNYCLGGAASHNLVFPFMKYSTDGTLVNRGIFKQICDRLEEMGGLPRDNDFNEEYLKYVLEQMCSENGISLLYGTPITSAKKSGDRIESIEVDTKIGKLTFQAKYFIDATGDANLSFLAGVPYKIGRDSDNLCQSMTLCFRVCGAKNEFFIEERAAMQQMYNEYKKKGIINNPRENLLMFPYILPGVIHFNSTRISGKSPLDAFEITTAQITARKQAFEIFYMLKNNFKTFKDATLYVTAPEIGIRESRKIEGDYTVTEEDFLSYRVFEDSIACGAYEVDIHNPNGTGTELIYLEKGKYYTIPYSSLLPKTVENMLVVGRCISSTHKAQSAYRIMPIVCCIGEGAGTAIAVANKNGTDTRGVNISEVQNLLTKHGAKYN